MIDPSSSTTLPETPSRPESPHGHQLAAQRFFVQQFARQNGRLWLKMTLALFMIGFGLALVGTLAVERKTEPVDVLLEAANIDAASSASTVGQAVQARPAPLLPGFQRRGTSLVGEVRTSDGTLMRLVFDARTHALIGFRILPDPIAAAEIVPAQTKPE